MLGNEAIVSALWLICALGTVALAAAGTPGRRGLVWIGAGLVAGAAGVRVFRLPAPEELAAVVALVAFLRLVRPQAGGLAAATAGVAAGAWSRVLELQGVPLSPALLAAVALPVAVVLLAAWRPSFAPAGVRDEALAVVFVAAILAAIAPDILDGWRSAQALNIDEAALDALSVPAWTAAVGLMALAGGGAWAIWSRR